jgi:hypothetical protein
VQRGTPPRTPLRTQEIKSAKIIITDEEGKEYTAALSYGNAFLIKDELMEMGFVYWTYKARKLILDDLPREQVPAYLLQTYPLYIYNGFVEDVDDMAKNSNAMNEMALNIKRQFNDRVVNSTTNYSSSSSTQEVKLAFNSKKYMFQEPHHHALFALLPLSERSTINDVVVLNDDDDDNGDHDRIAIKEEV